MNIDVIRKRIARLRRLWFTAAIGHAAARWLTMVLTVAVLVFLADWLFLRRIVEGRAEDLRGRTVLVAVALAVLAWRAWRLLRAAWRARQDEDGIALRIERDHPALEGRLISAIQLQRALDAGRDVGSRALIDAVEAQAVAQCVPSVLADVVDARPLRGALLRFGIVLLPLIGVALWQPETSRAFVRRLLLQDADYPSATRLIAVTVPATTPVGESFTVSAVVDPRGTIPSQGRVLIRVPGSGESASLAMPPDEGDAGRPAFRAVIENPTEDFDIQIILFDARSEWRHVRVLPRPSILSVRLRYTFPAYTELPAEDRLQGDVEAVVGTRVTIVAQGTKPVRCATLAFAPKASGATRTQALTVAEDGMQVAGEFVVDTNGAYTIRLEDTDGMTNLSPPEWTVAALVDQAPEVRVSFPAQDQLATPTGRWPLRFSAVDDFGLAEARFCYEVQDPLQEDPIAAGTRALGPATTNGVHRRAALRAWIDMHALRVLPGQQLHYWVEVGDRCAPVPNWGRSRTYSFEIGDTEAVREVLKGVQDAAIRQLGLLAQSEEADRVHVDRTRRVLRKEATP